jgi:hypothetical protein
MGGDVGCYVVALGVMWWLSGVMWWWVGGVMWCMGGGLGCYVVVLGVMWCNWVGCDGWSRGFMEMWCSEGSLIGLCHTQVIGLA